MLYCIDRFLGSGIKRIYWAFLIFVSGMIIFYTKAYVIMALVPALLIWVVLSYKDRISNKLIRTLIVPVLMVLSIGAIVGSINLLGQYDMKYSADNFFKTADDMQNWHYKEGREHKRNARPGFKLYPRPI